MARKRIKDLDSITSGDISNANSVEFPVDIEINNSVVTRKFNLNQFPISSGGGSNIVVGNQSPPWEYNFQIPLIKGLIYIQQSLEDPDNSFSTNWLYIENDGEPGVPWTAISGRGIKTTGTPSGYTCYYSGQSLTSIITETDSGGTTTTCTRIYVGVRNHGASSEPYHGWFKIYEFCEDINTES